MPADVESDRHQTIATLHLGEAIARPFYAAESSLSNQDRTRLTIASGRENSDLGLILHVASHDRQHVAFWDPESPTIQLLHDDRCKPQCTATRWSKELKRFHDEFSADVAKILPLPFLIVAGVCPANSYTKFLDKSAKFVEVIISPPDGKIKFCLEFDTEGQCLKRITLIIDHPAAIFYAKPAFIREINMRLDAGLNIILWLLGKKYTVAYFLRKGSICHSTRWTPNGFEHGLKGAPLVELYAHWKQETNSEKHLKISCFSAPFLEWAASYLGENPNSILQRGLSLASAIQDKMLKLVIKAEFGHKNWLVVASMITILGLLKHQVVLPSLIKADNNPANAKR
ncbi:hypothetical protein F5B17DRAFT_453391 [Nemania serpens]|nr:hypothetical protein F5B17DRAFT_453391 [Nemania serpens]